MFSKEWKLSYYKRKVRRRRSVRDPEDAFFFSTKMFLYDVEEASDVVPCLALRCYCVHSGPKCFLLGCIFLLGLVGLTERPKSFTAVLWLRGMLTSPPP